MEEYLLDVSKNVLICVKSLHDGCECYKCREERDEKKKEDAGENSKPVDKSQG
jgi:hypothetical protein